MTAQSQGDTPHAESYKQRSNCKSSCGMHSSLWSGLKCPHLHNLFLFLITRIIMTTTTKLNKFYMYICIVWENIDFLSSRPHVACGLTFMTFWLCLLILQKQALMVFSFLLFLFFIFLVSSTNQHQDLVKLQLWPDWR